MRERDRYDTLALHDRSEMGARCEERWLGGKVECEGSCEVAEVG